MLAAVEGYGGARVQGCTGVSAGTTPDHIRTRWEQ